jgi:ketosteroid isomerase-like protein
MAADLEAPDVGHLINGPCDDPRVQESHIRAMIAIAKWTEAATERINATPEWQARLCQKIDELRGLFREQLVIREAQKEMLLKVQFEQEQARRDFQRDLQALQELVKLHVTTVTAKLGAVEAWQTAHDTRQVRKEDLKEQRVWELVKPMIQIGVPLAVVFYGAHLLGWIKGIGP